MPAPSPKAIGAAVVVAVAAGAIGFAIDDQGGASAVELRNPDTPPTENAYLDTLRVNAYLSELEGGLSGEDKRTLGLTSKVTAGLEVQAAKLGSERQASEQLEQDLKVSASDRFYRLLRFLRSEGQHDTSSSLATGRRWLWDIEALPTAGTPDARADESLDVLRGAKDARKDALREGDFVRLERAHLEVPRYAGILPKLQYVRTWSGPGVRAGAPVPVARTSDLRQRVARYQARLGPNPRVPLVVPIAGRSRRGPITVLAPVRYDGLSSEPTQLSGQVTVVGKVVYRDLRSPGENRDPPTDYVDQESRRLFGGALRRAGLSLRTHIGLTTRDRRGRYTFRAPLVVIIPLAIYQ